MSCKPIDVKFSEQKDRFCAEFGSQSDPLEAAFKDVGVKGASAYEIAVMRGFRGTVDEWLDSLHGKDGKPGKDGAPGQPGADGHTPVRGKDYWTETDKQKIAEEVLEKVPSGGGAAIIDVIALPTENIDEDSFYRLLTGTFVLAKTTYDSFTCYCVESLPETGEPVTVDMQSITAYYNVQDGGVYGYINDMLSAAVGVPAGWYALDILAPSFGVGWGGVITNILDDPNDGAFRLLLEYVVYSYKDGWISLKPIGRAGTGAGAETFNHGANIASGDNSHTEGWGNVTSSNAGHTEGESNVTNGYAGHTEGVSNTTNGYAGHTEGVGNVTANNAGHTEGLFNFSGGRSQHVQGEYNAIDPEYDENAPDKRGKYVHIVGNGDANNLSNAHTLDWEGNAWFAGGIELTSPNGTRFRFTVSDDGALTATVVTE